MGTIAALVAKDIRRRLADPAGLLLTLMIPLVIAGLMALAFGQFAGGPEEIQKLRAVVLDLDESPLSTVLTSPPRDEEAARRLEIVAVATREEGMQRMREDQYPALLVIPEGFTKGLLRGEKVQIELVKNPSQGFSPVAAQQAAEVLALYLSVGARVLDDFGPQLESLLDGEERSWSDSVALAALATAVYARIKSGDNLIFPPLIEVSEPEAESAGERLGGFNFLSWMYPGMIVMGLMFVGIYQMKDLLREREAGTLKRQLASPIGAGALMAAKIISVAVVVMISAVVMMVMGSAAFRMTWGPPGRMLLAVLLSSFAVTGFSALIYAIVRTERQGDALGGIITMVMSLLGGAFAPSQIMPPAMQKVSVLSLNYWANGALRSLSSQGGRDIGVYLVVLAVIGALCTTLGVAILARRHFRGAV